ncbi:MAG: hypothetical protein PHC61_02675 [Chitinivibrionales bacterium]|nr:hypothetical protein [Chitinivibrionales bacterium]
MKKQNMPINPFLKLSVSLVFILISCSPPSKITEKPVLNADAPTIANQVVFALKTLRIIHDVREVTDRFTFAQFDRDSLQLQMPDWDPRAINQYYQKSLAKSTGGLKGPFASASALLAKSGVAPVATLVRSYAKAKFDTVFLSADSLYCGVAPLDSSLIAPGYNRATDSVFWRFAAADSIDTLLVRIIRLQKDTITNNSDLQRWDYGAAGNTFSMIIRQQDHFSGALRIYQHHSKLANQIIFDTVATASTATTAFYYLERQDNSSGWWRTLDSSKILLYRDSLATADSTRSRTIVDTASGGTIDLTADTLQPYLLTSKVVYNQTNSSTTVALAGAFDPKADSNAIYSFYKKIKNISGDSAEYWLPSIDTTSRCTLMVKLSDHLAASGDTTFFGPRSGSTYHLQIRHSAHWDSVLVDSVYREDKESGSIASVTWSFKPQSPVVLQNKLVLTKGMIVVRSFTAIDDTVTGSRQWSRCDTAAPVAYTSAWVGKKGDTVRLSESLDGGDVRYSYSQPTFPSRRGRLQSGGQFSDTLYGPTIRVLSGTLDSSGFGLITVSGLDSFALQISRDTVLVIAQGGKYIPVDRNFNWQISGDQFQGHFFDSALALNCAMTATMDRSGVIRFKSDYRGAAGDSAVFSAQYFLVTPLYDGRGYLYGLVNGAGNENLATTLKIDLWNYNTLADEPSFK